MSADRDKRTALEVILERWGHCVADGAREMFVEDLEQLFGSKLELEARERLRVTWASIAVELARQRAEANPELVELAAAAQRFLVNINPERLYVLDATARADYERLQLAIAGVVNHARDPGAVEPHLERITFLDVRIPQWEPLVFRGTTAGEMRLEMPRRRFPNGCSTGCCEDPKKCTCVY